MNKIFAASVLVGGLFGEIPLSIAANGIDGTTITITIDADAANLIRQWRAANGIDKIPMPLIDMNKKFLEECEINGGFASKENDTQYCT